LASKAYAGRGYVFDGDRKAAAFIAAEYQKNGLLPLGTSYYQPFSMPANVFPKDVKIVVDGRKLKLGEQALIEAASPSLKGKFILTEIRVPADPAAVDQLIQNPLFKDKFLVVDERAALATMKADQLRMTLLRLASGGYYKGILVQTEQKLLWRGATNQLNRPIVYVKNNNVIQLEGKVLQLKVQAVFQENYLTNNVCGMIKGTSESDSLIVITAHYDHVGAIGKRVVFTGANDNASGTALLLYLATYYRQHPPKYNTVFLAFSGEESGLLGSTFFANNPLIDLRKIKFLLNFDMAGTGDDGIQVVNGTIFKDQFERLVAINKDKKYLPEVKVRGPMNRSDHYPFYAKGVPSFFIYTLGGIA
ncbi:MAG: M28 family metallopeptidase, partial [Sphingobacterium sp.]